MLRSLGNSIICIAVPLVFVTCSAFAQDGDQDEVPKALDSTATQWSFQFAYQAMPDYKDDIVDG
jgi:hypothetical protein